jgi:signal peptidase I
MVERGQWKLWRVSRDLLFSVVVAFLFVIFVYQPVKVEGYSMMPRLADNERIFINKFIYRFEDIQRGDVVVFWYPLDPSKSFIKRVIGMPGDHVKIVAGSVYVNGTRLQEPYVLNGYTDHWNYPETAVPPHHYFVLGDHRNSSNDSRAWGCVDRDYIYGKAVFAYWPLNKLGLVD